LPSTASAPARIWLAKPNEHRHQETGQSGGGQALAIAGVIDVLNRHRAAKHLTQRHAEISVGRERARKLVNGVLVPAAASTAAAAWA